MARRSQQVVGREVLSNAIKVTLSQEIKSQSMKLVPPNVGRSQIQSNRTPTLRQECNAIAAMLNDVAANSYEELRAIRRTVLRAEARTKNAFNGEGVIFVRFAAHRTAVSATISFKSFAPTFFGTRIRASENVCQNGPLLTSVTP
jgi:hypothetical protein